jgi:hypothetical protein
MRLWTLHPRYLDARGLVALWREALLAQKVLLGATKGYTRHPQLTRFREALDPPAAVATYLIGVLEEATRRGYAFDAGKVAAARLPGKIKATKGQLLYEWRHLQTKLRKRDPAQYARIRSTKTPAPHPLFRIVAGEVSSWERVKQGES